MNALEKDKIFILYNENKIKELVKIFKNKTINLNEITNSFGENIIQHFIADKNYTILSIALKHQKNRIENPPLLLSNLLENIKIKTSSLTKKTEHYKIKDFLESIHILAFHPLMSLNRQLMNNIICATNMTNEYPVFLDNFLNKNKVHLNEVKKFLNCINDKSYNSIKMDSELYIKNILTKKILADTVNKKNNNNNTLKV